MPPKRDAPEKPAKDAEGGESSEEEFEWENDSVAKLADWVIELKQATATLLKRNGELRTKVKEMSDDLVELKMICKGNKQASGDVEYFDVEHGSASHGKRTAAKRARIAKAAEAGNSEKLDVYLTSSETSAVIEAAVLFVLIKYGFSCRGRMLHPKRLNVCAALAIEYIIGEEKVIELKDSLLSDAKQSVVQADLHEKIKVKQQAVSLVNMCTYVQPFAVLCT